MNAREKQFMQLVFFYIGLVALLAIFAMCAFAFL